MKIRSIMLCSVLLLAGCGTPDSIKQNTYHGVEATKALDSLTGVESPLKPHINALKACWLPIQIWTGLPENPMPYSPAEAIQNAQLAKQQAEWQVKMEERLIGLTKGQFDWTELIMLILGGGTIGGGLIGYPVVRKIRKKLTKNETV